MIEEYKQIREWIVKARNTASNVVRMIEDTGNNGGSPSPVRRADWQAAALEAYAAMSFANNTDDILSVLSRLEAREAETPKDIQAFAWHVYEVVGELAEKAIDARINTNATLEETQKRTIEALAAEIERYVQTRIAAAPKTVPMAMLRDIYFRTDKGSAEEVCEKIASGYGYAVEEERNGR